MSVFTDWPHRWFGVWSEDAASPAYLPHRQDFVDPEWRFPRALQYYLLHCPVLIFGSCGAWRTDGAWLWWDAVAGEIDSEYIRLPDAFVEHIQDRNFEPTPYLETTIQALHDGLEWPDDEPFFPFAQAVAASDGRALITRKFYSFLKDMPSLKQPPRNLKGWLLDSIGIVVRE